MSDRKKSPFAAALHKSKSFIANIKLGQNKSKPQVFESPQNVNTHDCVTVTDMTGNDPNYKRRMRVVADSERRENPLNLGEGGWGEQSWKRKQQEKQQMQELEELWSEMGSTHRKPGDENQRQTVTDPRILMGQARPARDLQDPATMQDRYPREIQGEKQSRRRSGGSPAQYHRTLPFRVSGPRDPPPPSTPPRPTRVSDRDASPLARDQRGRVRGTYLSTESGTDTEAHLPDRSLRTRVAGPRPNNIRTQTGSYNSHSTRVTPGSFGDTEREDYLARLRARGGGSKESRAAGDSPS